ncbi:acetyl/propionyl/methylcrotonyl-CoA carboxylase subunit alpha [Cellulomonas biazotea]|uniref:biotin carboxylase n=1 Tax=Cellulomonas biazotea TaxID=1709 RepID=A0A402DPM1_9CELL|nr:biotin carboxylase N-terminal domain-containing protein [Cellulomonas biazotea]GCE76064.1 acetyl/propionyl-CoA carboxylase subuit alpha [Cellulomonas biazotea]
MTTPVPAAAPAPASVDGARPPLAPVVPAGVPGAGSTPAPPSGLFATVLVANRGEIACRVIRTLRRLGIRSVAVWSDADRDAVHVGLADVAVRLGPAEPRASYLDVAAVVRAAVASGADAVHPGYGFLSENADLARACADAGVVFVGPGIEALDLMGDKVRAKAHVVAAGVPVTPGVALAGLTDDEAADAVARLGYPVLVKPSAGGGGKGMTVVERPDDLADALVTSRRVAAAAFGDDTLLVERLVATPRHIEVQLLADAHGAVVHLGERECSLQRRHQKVVEEAPSPLLDAATRARIGAAACDVARSVGYVGAGTVEFLVSDDAPTEFFFMEMNTRLQVEHPVTELVTGLDLVEWQVRVAAGEPLGFGQDDVRLTGHAVEARVYAEDPARDFLPTTGTVRVLDEPTGDGIRVDSALRAGLEVGSTYDPMLAKVVAWAPDRAEALRRLDGALARTTVLGVRTNVSYLRHVLVDPDVRAGRLDTGLLGRLTPAGRPGGEPPSSGVPVAPSVDGGPGATTYLAADVLAPVAAVLWRHTDLAAEPEGTRPRRSDAWRHDGWRLGDPRPTRYEVAVDGGDVVEVAVLVGAPRVADGLREDWSAATVTVADRTPVSARLTRRTPDTAEVDVDGVVHVVRLATDGPVTWVGVDGAAAEVRFRSRVERLAEDLAAVTRGERPADPTVRAPMPGIVVAVDVESGAEVVAGQPLLTIEAMKMEHRLAAPTDGVVTLTVRPADRVSLDHVVATITPHPHEGNPS